MLIRVHAVGVTPTEMNDWFAEGPPRNDRGAPHAVLDGVVLFEQAMAAYSETAERKDGHGKLLIAVAGQETAS